MKTLIPLSEYVELQEKVIPAEENGPINDWNRIFMRRIISYTRFLRQPLTLGMFVPADDKGNVLTEPKLMSELRYDIEDFQNKLIAYEKAAEKVLFTGFSVGKFGFKDQYYVKLGDNMKAVFPFPNFRNYTIENLIEFGVELTPSALKLIGIEE